jgi:hypothetical protein
MLKMQAKVTAIYPFDRAAFNGQRLRPIREEDTYTHLYTHEKRAVAQDCASAERKVGKEPLSHT